MVAPAGIVSELSACPGGLAGTRTPLGDWTASMSPVLGEFGLDPEGVRWRLLPPPPGPLPAISGLLLTP